MFHYTSLSLQTVLDTFYNTLFHNMAKNSIGLYDILNTLAHGLVGVIVSLAIPVYFKDLTNVSKSGISRPSSVLSLLLVIPVNITNVYKPI